MVNHEVCTEVCGEVSNIFLYASDAKVFKHILTGAVLWLPDVCCTCLHFFIFLLVFGYLQY